MRSTGNIYPEWSHMGREQSFRHSLLIVVVATAVGAIASAAVILALIDEPVTKSDALPISARAIISNVGASGGMPADQDRAMVPTNVQLTPTATVPASDVAAIHIEAANRPNVHSGHKSWKENRTGSRRVAYWRRFARAYSPFSRVQPW
jgi:hypothetical protein